MDSADTIAFLKEREEKLGAPIKWRSYAPWFAKLRGEKREYGVFLYTDGKTMVYEDFDREPTILGIPIGRNRKRDDYVKLEASFPVSAIKSIDRVTKTDAVRSYDKGRDCAANAGILSIALRKLVTKITLSDNTIYYMELMDHKKFVSTIKEFQKED